jgi:hypothetical protein
MTVIRKFAVQGHAVPSVVHSPRGPFPPEVLAQPQREDGDNHSDSLHVSLDNTRFFKCRACEEVLLETDLTNHDCEEINGYKQ